MSGFLFLTIAITGLVTWQIREGRQTALVAVEVATQNLAHTLAYGVDSTIHTTDQALLTVADELHRQQRSKKPDDKEIAEMLRRQLQRLPDLYSLTVSDRDGVLVFGQGVDREKKISIADRPYFVTLRDNPNAGLVISEPHISRVSRKAQIAFGRRVNCADGSFCGIVLAPMHLDRFVERFAKINIGAHGLITLRTREAALLARFPALAAEQGQPGHVALSAELKQIRAAGKNQGTYVSVSPTDQINRVSTYLEIDDHPFFIVVGLALDEQLIAWRRTAQLEALFAGLLILMLAAGFWRLGRDAQNREAHHMNTLQEHAFRQKIIESLPGMFYVFDASGRFQIWNHNLEAVSGYDAVEIKQMNALDFFAGVEKSRIAEAIQRALTTGAASIEAKFQTKDGTQIPYFFTGVRGERDGLPIVIGLGSDITERLHAEENLKLAASVFSHAREGIMITAPDSTIIDVNEAFTRLTGYSRDEVLGKTPRILNSGRQKKEHFTAMWQDLVDPGHWTGEVWNRRKNGEVYAVMQTVSAVRDAHGKTQQYVALFSDITPLKEHEQQLEHIAHYDALTAMPNRVLLADRLHQAMSQAKRRGQRLAVAYLDLDGFKFVNDTHGHDAGDQLLIAVAARMKQALRDGDTLARIGGDEFVVVMLDLSDDDASVPMLNRLLAAAAEPVPVGDLTLQVSASVGVTFFPQTDDIDADQLLRQADQAMYLAKQAGKNRFHFFDTEQDRSVRGHHENIEHISRALRDREFVLYYQPKVNMRSGQIIGAEALIRWQHPEKGLLPPAVFLPVIENHALAVDIGEWVIDAALTQIEVWQAAGLDIPVSVNIGARQLQHAGFVLRLRELLAAHPGVSPEKLELEVLETSALEDLVHVSQIIEACRDMGVTFALDDFGTGYSSLTYLKRLPVTLLKIDQSFVRDMLVDPDDLAILNGVIGLATAFRREVIAEGVETVEHGEVLLGLGCDLAQGYGIARPMPAIDLPAWTLAWRTDPVWSKLRAVR